MTKHNYIIGIDCGVNTGITIINRSKRSIVAIKTVMIHQAMQMVKDCHQENLNQVFVRVEDARQRKWFGKNSNEKMQGAGSIKRDAKIWEDFLTSHDITFEMVAPKNNRTKLTSESFKKITGYQGQTSVHARDAAMLVIGM
jgi:hypothetical protein